MTVVELRPGAHIWFEGDIWLIEEMGPKQATIKRGTRFRAVALGAMVSAAQVVGEPQAGEPQAEPVNVVLAALTPAQREPPRVWWRVLISTGEWSHACTEEVQRRVA